MPNEKIKLKPCPFCGGEAKALLGYILHLDENGNEVGFYEESTIWFGACVYCPKCRCEIEKKSKAFRSRSGRGGRKMTVCDRCRKELKERAAIERYIKITGYFVIFSETGVLCKDCWLDLKRFMKPGQNPPKEEKDG